MSSELIRKAQATPDTRNMRARTKEVYDSVRLHGLQADGAMALAGHIMQGAVELDNHRRMLAQGDPVLNSILTEIEARALLQVGQIQSGLFNFWSF